MHPEPLLGYFGHFLVAIFDLVLVVEDITLHFQIGGLANLDHPAIAYRSDNGFFDRGYWLTAWSVNIHRIADTDDLLLDLAEGIVLQILE